MMLLLVLFILGALLEIVLHVRALWAGRKVLAVLALLCTAFAAGGVTVWRLEAWTILLAVLCVYRIFNNLRLVEGRMHEGYLRRATLRTSLRLLGFQFIAVVGWLLWERYGNTGHGLWTLLAAGQLAAAVVLFSSTTRRLRRTAWPKKAPGLSDDAMPTLTVAIPARNETEDLQACLESLTHCDYPKIEIIVLDDCSQTRRTPEIIRAFAHDGVRFIEGQEPKPTWQPKNQAYDRLLKEASGEYVLFCGVDIRFAPDSLRQLVGMMVHKKKTMLSLLPLRAPGAERRFAVVQAMRYVWELSPPRRLFGRPPVLSSCWVAKKDELGRLGGFAAVTRAIVPEAHFARALARGDKYSFMRANQTLGIQSTKPAKEQYDTAIRMRYPQLHRRPENVFLLSFAYVLFLLAPLVFVLAGIWISIGLAAYVLAVASSVLLIVVYMLVVTVTRTGSRWLGLVAFPFGLLYDITLLHISMYQYEFSVVDWKGRNICVPAMHVIPHLPKIS